MTKNQIPNKMPVILWATKDQVIDVLQEGHTLLLYHQKENQEVEVIMLVPSSIPYLDVNLFPIAAHDYRHYFGEVVDLKEYTVGANTISYCGNNFQLVEHSGSFHLWNITNGGVGPVISNAKPECQQWLINHFTDLFKKDMPHLNIKFVWS